MYDRMEGRLVKTFIALWEERSISRAAERLGYVQSTVTVHLKLLEEQLGRQLYVRSSRGVTPTESGEKVAPFMYRFLQLASTMEEAISGDDKPNGIVSIRLLESFYVSEWGNWLGRFLHEYPNIRVKIETGFQTDTVQEVLRHRIELGIVPMQPEAEELIFEPLVEDELVIAVSQEWGRKWAAEGWRALEGAPLLSFGEQCIYHTIGHRWLQQQHAVEHMALPSLDMVKQLIRSGLGIACLPRRTITQEAAEGQIVILPMNKPMMITHGIITHRERSLSNAARVFKEALMKHFNGTNEEDET
ncbi:transcriptional regulator, LysR family [Paenibacillus curdlanolyticus YK9]|uniref:Transcriptional regulator, LysR family n=1 Tax=Paenibacillus curdlanolyticus YK9 TaxID=717606 RepID=E0I8E3_9BACL|nr:LysR family transcriptional regulator [Paenibacillus curdlanolyticus]EFM11448.1 transcriptional regulator, LysR family [Paenibacillus curdlanolyticus YK9]